jgi:hypothetical protein
MVALGNLVIFLEALSYQSYLDLEPNSADGLTREEISAERARRVQVITQLAYARATFATFRGWFVERYQVLTATGGHPIDIEHEIYHVSVILTSLTS